MPSPVSVGRVAHALHATSGADMNIDILVSDARPGHASRRAAAGRRHPRAAVHAAARRKRRQTYPELGSRACDGRASSLLGSRSAGAAWHRAAGLPPPLRAAACAGWVQRWSFAMRAFSLLELPPGGDFWRKRRPTSTRSSPLAEAAPCSQAVCQCLDSADRCGVVDGLPMTLMNVDVKASLFANFIGKKFVVADLDVANVSCAINVSGEASYHQKLRHGVSRSTCCKRFPCWKVCLLVAFVLPRNH